VVSVPLWECERTEDRRGEARRYNAALSREQNTIQWVCRDHVDRIWTARDETWEVCAIGLARANAYGARSDARDADLRSLPGEHAGHTK